MHPETPPVNQTTRKHLLPIILLSGLALLAILAVGCCVLIGYTAVVDNPFLSSTCFNGDRAALERYAKFRFPPSATNIHEECHFWQGGEVWIWFEMDPADLDSFVESTQIEPPLTQGNSAPGKGPSLDENAIIFGKWFVSPYGQELWIDTSNPDRYQVVLRFTEI